MLTPGPRTRVRRNARRAEYDRETIHAILDAEQIAHVAYVEDGEPRLMSTLYVRIDDALYLHGNRTAALLGAGERGQLLSVSVFLADGVVVARSSFHCSMNYRSVILFGHGEAVPEADKPAVLDQIVEGLIPGHVAAVRPMTTEEINATSVIRVPIEEASAKVRDGDPNDDKGDLDGPSWAGVVPYTRGLGEPIDSSDLKPGIDVPPHIRRYSL